jgi:hypothetical protein
MKIKYLIFIFVITSLLVPRVLWASVAVSNQYRLEVSGQDSGSGTMKESAHKIHQQSVASLVRLQNQPSVSNGRKMFQGFYVSPSLFRIDGLSVYNRQNKLITANVSTFVSQVEYAFRKADSADLIPILPNSVSNLFTQNFIATWDSMASLPTETAVFMSARIFDGLTWTQWVQPFVSSPYIVDNVPPRVPLFNLLDTIFSPNGPTSVGVKDIATFNFSTEEGNPNNWKLDIYKDAVLEKSFTGTSLNTTLSQAWDGKNTANSFVEDGVYRYVLTAKDKLDWETVVSGNIYVDNTAPVFFNPLKLYQSLKPLNSSQTDLSANWKAIDGQTSVSYTLSYARKSFFPHQISGLKIWLDATDPSSITQDSNGYVSEWKDKSNSKTKFLAEGSSRPRFYPNQFSGFPSILFDGVNDFMKTNTSNMNAKPGTVFMVIKQYEQNNMAVLLSKGNEAWAIRNNGLFSLF